MTVSSVTRIRWDDLPRERLGDKLERRYITGEHITLAQFFLAEGCVVPRHSHASEQMTFVLQGRLRFFVGGEPGGEVEVGAGEVLHIPPHVPHSAQAVEDSVVSDSFSPIRGDWIEKRDDYLRR